VIHPDDTAGKQAMTTFWALTIRSELELLVLTMVLIAPNKFSYQSKQFSANFCVVVKGIRYPESRRDTFYNCCARLCSVNGAMTH
jgi:hypothetical protein